MSNKQNFIEELRWRNMLQDIMPETENLLNSKMVKGYIGFDPTADSLGMGNMVQIMTLMHFQRAGHQPIALLGGATGMVGDPSGKSAERNLLDEETLNHNLNCQKAQLEKFLDFDCGDNSAQIVNNYDWFKQINFLDFIRDTGKHITVNYMMAKDSVKNRLESGMSFTEFSYQLVQGYDFYYLWKNQNVQLQMGGSDQWGNIVTGTELIRRKDAGEAYALTTPLIKKADGTKFGKSEKGNIWLDAKKTTPYSFYQFWLNSADSDVVNYIRIFSLLGRTEIEALEVEHNINPSARLLQKTLGKEITIRVHNEDAYNSAVKASEILFNKGTAEELATIDESTLLSAMEGVPQAKISKSELENGINIIDFLSEKIALLPSKTEAKKMLLGNGISINKEKVNDITINITSNNLIKGKYIVAQKGKKEYCLVIVE
ncbi:MAG: tyrosine--tRNA ligase [Bacteroidetes bacterium]|nr:tyrosine--tRNA ligase [Bacteroidota bacterium]